MPVIQSESVPRINRFTSAMASWSGPFSFVLYNLSSNDENYLMSKNLAETTPRQSDHIAHLLTTTMLYYNSPPELPKSIARFIRISMITTPTQLRLAVHFVLREYLGTKYRY